MNSASALSFLRDARLAACATSLEPAWVWSNDGTRVLWANAVAVALLGASNLTALRHKRFTANDKPAAHVMRLAASLPESGAARLERMRGFGTGFFRMLTCTCSRIVLGDGTSAILIAATEQAGPVLSLTDRARTLLEDSDEAIAAFSTDGTLLYATPKAAHRMAGANTLIAFEANALAAEAIANGSSAGRTLVGPTSLLRAGSQGSALLIASFGTPLETAHDPAPPVAPSQAATAAPEPVAAPESSVVSESVAAQPVAIAPASAETNDSPPSAQHSEPAAPALQPVDVPEALSGTEPPAAADMTNLMPPPPPPTSAPAVAPPRAETPRTHPLRFVWQMDADGRFTLSSDDFIDLVGPATARVIGQRWSDINTALAIDADGRVARAIATRDTWSGIMLSWPVDGVSQRIKIELSGLPIYDRQRNFIGYRGFGVCRDLDTLATIAAQRREAPPAPTPVAAAVERQPVPTPPAPAASHEQPASVPTAEAAPVVPPSPPPAPQRAAELGRQTITFIGPAPNVVPFRVADARPAPGLNAGERNTFTEIARQLSARLKSNERPAPAPQPAVPQEEGVTPALRAAPASGIDGRASVIEKSDVAASVAPAPREEAPPREPARAAKPAPAASEPAPAARPSETPAWLAQGSDARALLDRLPLGVLVYRIDTMLYANRTFLSCVGYESLGAFSEAGGIDSLFIEMDDGAPGDAGAQTLTITTGNGDKVPVEGKLFPVPWNGESALALVLVGSTTAAAVPAQPAPPPPVHDDSELRARLLALEDELVAAKRASEAAGKERTDLLGHVGTEVRTPLMAIIDFVETMLNEKYGPIGNERYRTYLTDIHYSGSRILSLFDNLASLTKIDHSKPEATGINLNEIVQGCVAQMQAEASRVRVLIRTSLANPLPGVAAEQDSVRQVVLNLLTNSIRFAGAGGQVIVSTARDNDGRVLLRLRDTGPGLSDGDLAQLRSTGKPSASAEAADQQLSLAVVRALLEANHASLSVTSKAEEGTLVEAVFLAAR